MTVTTTPNLKPCQSEGSRRPRRAGPSAWRRWSGPARADCQPELDSGEAPTAATRTVTESGPGVTALAALVTGGMMPPGGPGAAAWPY